MKCVLLSWALWGLCVHSFCIRTSPRIHHGLWSTQTELTWYPETDLELPDDIEEQSLQLAADLVRQQLEEPTTTLSNDDSNPAKGHFLDLAVNGEAILESLFASTNASPVTTGAIAVLQSLCILGTQVGVQGSPEQLARRVAHLKTSEAEDPRATVRRLKHQVDKTAGLELLALLGRKRTTQGAFDLLVDMGVWGLHEDLALLRSGFPLRFLPEERVVEESIDIDEALGLRRDLRDMKVFTIDGASTSEIDDGLSVERVVQEDGTEREYLWIHIADAERYAPPGSVLYRTATSRMTSLYLPTGSISMFPPEVADRMSLNAQQDACALSMRVALNDDGSLDESSLLITPSLIRVDYRLTYDDVDEMLAEGIGYREEWELGALLTAAVKRRKYRIASGSIEGLVPNPIPQGQISVFPNATAPDGMGIAVSVQVTHNAGRNHSTDGSAASSNIEPVSSAYTLVTEAMILAGEGLGRWNPDVRLPFRAQVPPDFKARAREKRILRDLLEYNVGDGLCHAWYCRRFLSGVRVSEEPRPHSGLGLKAYVQWTSPIRRCTDLKVHATVKRHLRAQRIQELTEHGQELPTGVELVDDALIDYHQGLGVMTAARTLQRQSQQYWTYEYIRRNGPYTGIVLGHADKGRVAIYIYELGLEHKLAAKLDPGTKLKLEVESVRPRAGLLNFVRTNG